MLACADDESFYRKNPKDFPGINLQFIRYLDQGSEEFVVSTSETIGPDEDPLKLDEFLRVALSRTTATER